MKRKKNILNKIVRKNYNNELEKILEEKNFDENVKSILLSILYKIEIAYKDVTTVKKEIEPMDEYISNLLKIIKEQCNSIKILNMTNNQNIIPENRTYIINKKEKEIIAYPIERKILYAIAKMGKKERIIKDEYYLINETLSDLINVGNSINMVEPLRDFNGYSWTTISHEIESVDHNLIYQNLRILVGSKILNKWVENNEFMIDYFEMFKDELDAKYGRENARRIINKVSKISILLSYKFNPDNLQDYIEEKDKIKHELNKIQDRKKFVEEKTDKKMEITKKIKQIDTIINNKKLSQEEYNKRNEKLPLEKKIFSTKILIKVMKEEKEQYLKELEEINKILNPQKFVKYKRQLEEKYNYLKVLDVENKEKELNKLKLEFQKLFLELIEKELNKVETKQEIEKILYDFRYYLLLPYDNNNEVKDIEQLQEKIKSISEIILNKTNVQMGTFLKRTVFEINY